MASVALVGSHQQDNLALGYLASAAEAAGHAACIVRFDHARDTARCVSDIRKTAPDIVGLGISFHYAINDYLALARALRQSGYTGHITCGGHVPTFCYKELLAAESALSSAVRHEGEITLVEMLNALDNGHDPRNIKGLVWREGEEIRVGSPRPFVTDLDTLPWPKRRETPFEVAGFPIAFIIASRGCIGDCAYCVIRAFSKDAGGPLFRMRDPACVADEMTAIRRQTGARLVMMEDDLFILPNEGKTIARMHALKTALTERGVYDLLFWVKARPETITRPVLDAARELGVAQIFLGVEQSTLPRLRYLGRKHTPEDNVRAIRLVKEYDIQPCFNLMLFDPDCRMDEVDNALDFAEANADVPWNLCRTEIYPGTRIYDRLQKEHRLTGDFTTIGYRMRDPACELMFRILRVAFYNRAFNFDSLLNRLGTLIFTLEAHRRVNGCPDTLRDVATGYALLETVNRDTVMRLKHAARFARETPLDDIENVRDFAVDLAMSMNEADNLWHQEVDVIFESLRYRALPQSPIKAS